MGVVDAKYFKLAVVSRGYDFSVYKKFHISDQISANKLVFLYDFYGVFGMNQRENISLRATRYKNHICGMDYLCQCSKGSGLFLKLAH